MVIAESIQGACDAVIGRFKEKHRYAGGIIVMDVEIVATTDAVYSLISDNPLLLVVAPQESLA